MGAPESVKHYRCEILTTLYGQRKMSAKMCVMSKADVAGKPQEYPVSPSAKRGSVGNTRLLPRAKMLPVPMNVFSGG